MAQAILNKMSTTSSSDDEEQSLFSSTPVISYSKSGDDPFTAKVLHQQQQRQQQQQDFRVRIGEHTPAYAILKQYNLMISAFRKENFDEIFVENDLRPNSSLAQNFVKRWKWGKMAKKMDR
jgi:hypothetical protein